jgi:single-strand DNA-binding protein
MAQEPIITVLGNVGTQPESAATTRGTPVTTFRLGQTPSRFNRQTNRWEDLETSWYTVTCWYEWGENVVKSLKVGEPVVVMGRLKISEWTTEDGQFRRRAEIHAISIGHDLRRGSSEFTKIKRDRPNLADDQNEVNAILERHEQQLSEDPWAMESNGEAAFGDLDAEKQAA